VHEAEMQHLNPCVITDLLYTWDLWLAQFGVEAWKANVPCLRPQHLRWGGENQKTNTAFVWLRALSMRKTFGWPKNSEQ